MFAIEDSGIPLRGTMHTNGQDAVRYSVGASYLAFITRTVLLRVLKFRFVTINGLLLGNSENNRVSTGYSGSMAMEFWGLAKGAARVA